MKLNVYTFLILTVTVFSSVSLSAQDYRVIQREDYRFEGEWPSGDGILYSYDKGLVLGTFRKGKPDGKCVCYKPNGEVYWGEFRRGKVTGHGRIYRDNGIVVSGGYRKGRYHGIDTLYRSNGTMHVGKYRNGKLISRISDTRELKGVMKVDKPNYPQIDLRRRQEDFLKELELIWEERNLMIIRKAGLVNPKFQGGDVEDFALWVNSQIDYPLTGRASQESRMVIVEFTVLKDGSVANVHAVFGSDPVLNEAAEKAVSRSPKWAPGEQHGEKKNVRLSVPIVFSM